METSEYVTKELFDTKRRFVVSNLWVIDNHKFKMRSWLIDQGLIIENGKIMSMRTLPFQDTDFIIRTKGNANNTLTDKEYVLENLRSNLNEYCEERVNSKSVVGMIALGFMESYVRMAIEICHINGIPR